jgi:ATP-binding cassette subfamily B protein
MSSTQPKPIFKSAILRRVFSFVGPYRFIFWINVFLGIFLAFATPIRPYLIQATVNLAIGKSVLLPRWVNWILPNDAFNSVLQLILAISVFQVAFIVIETIFRFCFTYGMSWLGQQVIRDLRNKVYQKIMYWEMRQFDKTPIGTLTTRTINDIESINDIFSRLWSL